jgi:hypothetical protein
MRFVVLLAWMTSTDESSIQLAPLVPHDALIDVIPITPPRDRYRNKTKEP